MTKEEFFRVMNEAFDNHTTDGPRTRDEWWAVLEEFARLRRIADYKMGRK